MYNQLNKFEQKTEKHIILWGKKINKYLVLQAISTFADLELFTKLHNAILYSYIKRRVKSYFSDVTNRILTVRDNVKCSHCDVKYTMKLLFHIICICIYKR